MTTGAWSCRGCRRPLPSGSPSYCSRSCLTEAAARRRAASAARARARRAIRTGEPVA